MAKKYNYHVAGKILSQDWKTILKTDTRDKSFDTQQERDRTAIAAKVLVVAAGTDFHLTASITDE